MGHIVKTPASTWRANWRDPSGRQVAKTFRTKKDASAFLATVEAEKSRGTYLDPSAGRVLFRNHAGRWEKSRQVELTTADAAKSRMRCHLIPQWGDWPLNKISFLDVQAWVTRLSGRLAAQTVISCFSLMSSIMKAAVRERLIAVNPCEGVRLPSRRKTATSDILISREELTGKLLPEIREQYRALVLTAAYAGLRWGECAGLHWRSVDLMKGRIFVAETAVEVSGHVSMKPYPKTEAGRRTVPTPVLLAAHLRRQAELVASGPDDLVFPDSVGHILRRSNFRRYVWKPAREAGGLPSSLTFHGLRHCYATWLVSEGVPVNVVQVALGHERASTTLNRYTHRPADYEDRLRSALTDCDPVTETGSADDPLTDDSK
ncbi:site-specific integrase [Frankia sp. Cj3]|uniref:tyrosine-type recombinase/integrase n=1 Tax=Frankia sp. Cj3 TaxID=2880976 RepID=UPI001EF4BB82|nr:site-specific integrase [Frankia sp. Cj3]